MKKVHTSSTATSSLAFTDDLLSLLKVAKRPRFEFTVEGEINGVPFSGKPDLGFETAAWY